MSKPGYVATKEMTWKGEVIERGQVVPGIEDHPNLDLFKKGGEVIPYFEYDGEVKDPDDLLEGVSEERLEADYEITFDDLVRKGPWFYTPDGEHRAKGKEDARDLLTRIQSS